MLQNKKIFLAKLSHGAIGEENSYLLGTLLVSKIGQLAIAHQEIAEKERTPFYTRSVLNLGAKFHLKP